MQHNEPSVASVIAALLEPGEATASNIVGLDPLATYRGRAVDKISGVSRVTRWRWIRAGKFPAPVQLGVNSVGWRGSDLIAWHLSLRPVAWAPLLAAVTAASGDILPFSQERPASGQRRRPGRPRRSE